MWTGWHKFDEFHLRREDFSDLMRTSASHLKIGFTMGFQMSVMCIGQLSMQSAVNALGSVAVAGYTVATKVDQVSVLVNNAMISAVSAFVSQNYGAGNRKQIRQGVRVGLIQTQALNVLMGVGILLLREPIVALFIEHPTKKIIVYSNGYLNWVAPCYLLLGFLAIYRCAVKSMGNTIAPFTACIVELVMRLGSTIGLCAVAGYLGVCLASPLAWLGACSLLVPVYYHMVTIQSHAHVQ